MRRTHNVTAAEFELSAFVSRCNTILDQIRTELSPSRPGPRTNESLQKVCELLGVLGTEADGWGFDSLCEVAAGLQQVVRIYGNNSWNLHSGVVVEEALDLISSILRQCEASFHQRLAVADLLETFERVGQTA